MRTGAEKVQLRLMYQRASVQATENMGILAKAEGSAHRGLRCFHFFKEAADSTQGVLVVQIVDTHFGPACARQWLDEWGLC